MANETATSWIPEGAVEVKNDNWTPEGATLVPSQTGQSVMAKPPVDLVTPAVIAGGAGAVGLIGQQATKFITRPINEAKPIDVKLKAIASAQFPNRQISPEDLPALLSEKYGMRELGVKKPLKSSIPNFDIDNDNIDKSIRQISSDKGLFFKRAVNPTVDSIARHIATNYKDSINNAYSLYRNGQSRIENIIEKSGQLLQSEDISRFLNKSLSDAEIAGATKQELERLRKVADAFSGEKSVILDALGNKIDTTKPVPFSQIKGNVSYLLGELPDKAKHAVASNWSAYIGKYVPKQAQSIYADMQDRYAKFAPARNTLFDLIDRDNQQFDTVKLSRRLRNFIKSGEDAGLSELLDVFSNGTDMVKPIDGLKDMVSELGKLSKDYDSFNSQAMLLKNQKDANSAAVTQAKAAIQKAQEEYANTILQIKKKNSAAQLATKTLLSEKAKILVKYPWRTKFWEKAAGLAVKGAMMAGRGLPLGVGALAIAGAVADPANAATSALGLGEATPLLSDEEAMAQMESAAKASKPNINAGKQKWEEYYKATKGGLLK